MRILIAFIVAFGIGAGSRWTGVPSLAPQAITGALLIIAMSTGYVSADRLLKRTSSPSVAVSVSTRASDEQCANGQIAAYGLPTDPDFEADIAFWRQKSEGLQLIIADLLRTNQQLRASGNAQASQGDDSVTLHLDLRN
jgi:XapX domain-containing protein